MIIFQAKKFNLTVKISHRFTALARYQNCIKIVSYCVNYKVLQFFKMLKVYYFLVIFYTKMFLQQILGISQSFSG